VCSIHTYIFCCSGLCVLALCGGEGCFFCMQVKPWGAGIYFG